MKHPSYHLRPNKAVDRAAFIDAIRRIERFDELSGYTYYGFGGPYLDDFRLLYEFCPEIKMISIEASRETIKRQNFHLPCGNIEIKNEEFGTFLTKYQANDDKSIFWLDYTELEYKCFEDFEALLSRVSAGSMVKITLRAQPQDYIDIGEDHVKSEKFRKTFEKVMPNPSVNPPRARPAYCGLLQDMLQSAAQRALPVESTFMFQPISSFYYSDGTGIFTLTGVVCKRSEKDKIKKAYEGWQFANLCWNKPKEIDVPVLSTKERLHLQDLLPCNRNAGRMLRKTLGYLVDEDVKKTENKLQHYSEFHRYFPYFMKAIP